MRRKRIIPILIVICILVIIGFFVRGYYNLTHTYTLTGRMESNLKAEEIQPLSGTIKVQSDSDTEVTFTDIETKEEYSIGYITAGGTEKIKLKRGKWYTVESGAEITLSPVNLRIQSEAADPEKLNTAGAYIQIDMETAKRLFESAEKDMVIVDVRRADEYAEGHIPGAISIPNESIDTEQPEELPDLDQEIYVYCRSGNRSKQAAEKLAAIGYTNIVEFGGIIDWTGDIAK